MPISAYFQSALFLISAANPALASVDHTTSALREESHRREHDGS
jgi:hypothetical protein